ncbi:BLUF domain-containing protein [Rhizorhabdus sp. FW153]|uniref:BLUF domain-containing protein n=1 Tax=Rhizorhabdus sp. FW153 TaxID=3400216 RepID=UPI003CF46673
MSRKGDMFLQLVYISTARATLELSDAEAILQTSRRRNAADEVSGLLIFDGKRFLQALEGPADQVARTYERIQGDPRHRAVVQLNRAEVSERQFGPWAMASQLVGPTMGTGSMIEQVDQLTDAIEDPNIKATLRSFARVRGSA